jgi:hypothetical protein
VGAKNNPPKSLTPPPTKNQNRLSGQMARCANGAGKGQNVFLAVKEYQDSIFGCEAFSGLLL